MPLTAFHEIVACALPAVAEMPVGAEGTAGAVTVTSTLPVALPPLLSETVTEITYVPADVGAVYVTDEVVPEIVPPVADHE